MTETFYIFDSKGDQWAITGDRYFIVGTMEAEYEADEMLEIFLFSDKIQDIYTTGVQIF